MSRVRSARTSSILAGFLGCCPAFLRLDNAHLASQLKQTEDPSERLAAQLSTANAAINRQNKHVEEYKTESDHLMARLKAIFANN